MVSAFATMLLTLGITTGVIFKYGASSFTFFYHHWAGFITASLTMAFTQACYCYATSFIDGKVTALGGNTGNPLYDVSPRWSDGADTQLIK
jgi:delta14-sterol reductase